MILPLLEQKNARAAIALLRNQTLGATLLVTSCCIGAGMIGLPVLSALAGFMPSSVAMLFCYFFTTLTGLLLLEATLWFDREVNLLSIVEFTLGKVGKFCTLFLFLFLFYCIFVAYLDGGGLLFSKLLSSFLHRPISHPAGILICTVLVSLLTIAGAPVIVGLNRGLLLGLVFSYSLLVVLGLSQVEVSHLHYMNWKASLSTVPILLICFGYQNLVPSLTHYLQRRVRALRFAIIVGNFIPFFIYFLWNLVILGLLPQPAASYQTEMITELLQGHAHYLSVLVLVNAFSLFAIFNSFLPSALSFIDFLKDGLPSFLQPSSRGSLLLYSLAFVPPLLCALSYPHLFLRALSFAGGFIDVLLFGVLPATVVLVGRAKKIAGPYQVAGGSFTPLLVLILACLILVLKLY